MATKTTAIQGIRKRIGVKGDTYEVRVRIKGHPEIQKTFRTFEDAKQWKRDKDAAISKGEKVSTKPDRILISEVVAWFKGQVPERQKTKAGDNDQPSPAKKQTGKVREKSETARLDIIAHDLGEFSIAALTHEKIDKYMKYLLETPIPKKSRKKPENAHPLYEGNKERTYSESSVRKVFYTLKKIVEAHAAAHNYPLDARQFSGHDIPRAWAGHKDRRLEGDEEARLYKAAEKSIRNADVWKRAITILLETGMRAQEFLKSTYDNLSTENRTLSLPEEIVKKVGRKEKKGIARDVPLSSKAVDAYEQQKKTRKPNEPRIFWQWKDTSSFDKAFKRISTRAGCPDVMPHTLRHEATARLFEKNRLTDLQIAKITGHTNMTTLSRYYKYRPQNIAPLLD